MAPLAQPKVLGDWLKWEEENLYCRDVVTVLVPADMPSGQVLGVESVFSKYAAYDNSNPAAAAAILLHRLAAKTAMTVTSIVDAANVSTVTTPTPHGLVVGDIVKVSGATGDTDLNANQSVVSVPTSTTFTIASASVTDATYTETTLRITKLNQQATVIVRGPAEINTTGLNWGTSDGTGVTAGLADLKLLNIIVKEAA